MILPLLFLLLIVPIVQLTSLQILGGIANVLGGIITLIVGILIIILVVGAALVFLPAIIVGIVIWFLTGSFFLAGLAFLVVAVLSLIALI